MKRSGNDRGNFNPRNQSVEQNRQNRYYHLKEDSDIYENEFANEEEFYVYGERHSIKDNNNIDNDGDYGYQHRDAFDGDYDPGHRNDAIAREVYEQRSRYVSKNPNRYRKPSKRRKYSDAQKRKLRRQHYTMMNLRVGAER